MAAGRRDLRRLQVANLAAHATPGAPRWRHAAYLLAWPGLDARAFLRPEPLPREMQPSLREWLFAAAKLLLGVAVFWGLSRLIPAGQEIFLGWVGMVGLVLLLHFGFFHLLSCLWRALGVEARPLMNKPLASTSLGEFWGRRWNTAFRDLTHRFLFRPLAVRLGPRAPWRGASSSAVWSTIWSFRCRPAAAMAGRRCSF